MYFCNVKNNVSFAVKIRIITALASARQPLGRRKHGCDVFCFFFCPLICGLLPRKIISFFVPRKKGHVPFRSQEAWAVLAFRQGSTLRRWCKDGLFRLTFRPTLIAPAASSFTTLDGLIQLRNTFSQPLSALGECGLAVTHRKQGHWR